MRRSPNSAFDVVTSNKPKTIPENCLILAKLRGFGVVEGIVKRYLIENKNNFFQSIDSDLWFYASNGPIFSVNLIEEWKLADEMEIVIESGNKIEDCLKM